MSAATRARRLPRKNLLAAQIWGTGLVSRISGSDQLANRQTPNNGSVAAAVVFGVQ